MFVGTLVDSRQAPQGQPGGSRIHVIEVEQWIKGDLGGTIEVTTPADGGACGFEIWDADNRLAAALWVEGNQITSNLCSQVDPDVILAVAAGPTLSDTGIGHLLVAHGWASSKLTVLDENGHLVAEYEPPGVRDFEGTTALDVCPGGELMAQVTPTQIFIWNLTSMEVVDHHAISNPASQFLDASCRDPEAAEIWAVQYIGDQASLMTLTDQSQVVDLRGEVWNFGDGFAIAQERHESDPVLTHLDDRRQVPLHTTPADQLWSIAVGVNEQTQEIALTETRFGGNHQALATLFIVNSDGELLGKHEIPWEVYSPVWVSDHHVAVQAYNWDLEEAGFVVVTDVTSGETTELTGLDGAHLIADGSTLIGTSGGSIMTASLEGGEAEQLVTLPAQGVGPIVVLPDAPQLVVPDETTTTIGLDPGPATPPSTVPPLVADGTAVESPGPQDLRWVGGTAIVGFLLLLVWLSAHKPTDTMEND